MAKPMLDRDAYNFYLGILAALDLVIAGHDQPVIAAEIIQAAGTVEVMNAARRSGYPFMKQLRKVYRDEGLES